MVIAVSQDSRRQPHQPVENDDSKLIFGENTAATYENLIQILAELKNKTHRSVSPTTTTMTMLLEDSTNTFTDNPSYYLNTLDSFFDELYLYGDDLIPNFTTPTSYTSQAKFSFPNDFLAMGNVTTEPITPPEPKGVSIHNPNPNPNPNFKTKGVEIQLIFFCY